MRKIFPYISLLMLLVFVQVGQAHSADMYFHTHTITISPDGMSVSWEISPGAMLAEMVWFQADVNQDGLVTDDEAVGWLQPRLDGLMAALDGEVLNWQIQDVDWPNSVQEIVTGNEKIQVSLWGDWPKPLSESNLLVINNFYKDLEITKQDSLFAAGSLLSVYNYSLQSERGVKFEIPEQDQGVLKMQIANLPNVENVPLYPLEYWESGTPDMPMMLQVLGLEGVAEKAVKQTQGRQGMAAILEGLVRTQEITPLFAITAFALALVLGSLHALSPGHGKTVVAAYLVGSQGRAYHAMALGGIVTLTHTGSVFALGLLTLLASRYILTMEIFPFMELISGLLIMVLGAGLLVPRLQEGYKQRRYRKEMLKQTAIVQDEDLGGRKRLLLNQPIEEQGPAHSHDPSISGYIPRGVEVGNPLAGVSWRSLVTLGISGGLVPCPDAIAILLIAVAINRIVFGLSMIVFFSLGLALILIVIGIMIVHGKRLFMRLQWFDRVSYLMPILSALVVMGLGSAMMIASLRNLSLDDLNISDDPQASGITFDIQSASILFTTLDNQSHNQLFIASVDGSKFTQLTQEPLDVWDFALSPNGNCIAYSTSLEDGSSLIKKIELKSGAAETLFDCGRSKCWAPVWAPDGRSILYSYLEYVEDGALLGFPSIWWFDLDTGETGPLFQDRQMPGYNPSYSADGTVLSYSSIYPLELRFYDLVSGDYQAVPLKSGTPAKWAPEGARVVQSDLVEKEDNFKMHVFLYDFQIDERTDLSGDIAADDYNPAWSPDGEWIAFIRKDQIIGVPAFGDQIWVMRVDGSDARPVTDDSALIHGQPVWSPDGAWLVYHTYTKQQQTDSPSVWILSLDTGEMHQIAAPAVNPVWLIGFGRE